MTTFNTSQANVNYLAAKTGLAPSVAAAWLANEGQSVPNPTNPLNIRSGGTPNQTGSVGGFGTYASPQAGLDAAAWLLKANGAYQGILNAIKGGTPVQQAKAIEASPWAGGHYGYANISSMVAGGAATPAPTGGASTPLTSTPSQTNPSTGTPFINIPEGKIIDLKDVAYILNQYDATGAFSPANDPLGAGKQKTINGLTQLIGQPWNDNTRKLIQGAFQDAAKNTPGTNILPNFDIVAAVMFVGVILIGVVFIGTGGLIAKKGMA